jgi:uncharacterized protein (UPF0371 family)
MELLNSHPIKKSDLGFHGNLFGGKLLAWIDAQAVFNGFTNDNFCKCLLEEDLQLSNYQSHPAIKAPLSN